MAVLDAAADSAVRRLPRLGSTHDRLRMGAEGRSERTGALSCHVLHSN
jgi:hypothetical protein